MEVSGKKWKGRFSLLSKVDAKGRVVIPVSVRTHLAMIGSLNAEKGVKTVVVTFGMEHCIEGYTMSEWTGIVNWFRRQGDGALDKSGRREMRRVMGLSETLEMDGLSRVMLPVKLMEYARIERICLFTKTHRGFEVWAPEVFEMEKGVPPDDMRRIAL